MTAFQYNQAYRVLLEQPGMPNPQSLICNTENLADPGSYGFEVERGDEKINGFVVKFDGQIYAYRNTCPHTGAPLDWVEHQFLDADGIFIQCAMHDARFVIDSGECIAGPCYGECLDRLNIYIVDSKIYLRE